MKKIILGIVAFTLIVSCKNEKKQNIQEVEITDTVLADNEGDVIEIEEVTPVKEKKMHWSYEGESGPEHWSEIEKNSDCDGKYQSPINIIDVNAKTDIELKALDIHYSTKTQIHDVVNNGHSIQYNFEEGDYIMFKGMRYDVKQIHFHESSEHTIDGVRYPMVIHMVHMNKNKEFVVIAIMVKEGSNSAPFDFLEKYLPIHKGESKSIKKPFDLNKNLPNNRGYYTYTGSLTTPPCTEGVHWFIFKDPITVSLEQLKVLQRLMPHNNYRNEQPLNDRIIRKTK